MENSEKIKEVLNQNNGYITTSDFIKLGISKSAIPSFVKTGLIRKVKFGLYIDYNLIEDEFYILQKKYPNVVFSHLTALYFLKLSPTISSDIDITIKRKDKVRGNYHVHYITDRYYEIGIIEVNSIYGNPIKIYNAERCICDMLRTTEIDIELQKKILANYFKSNNKDLKLLVKYSEVFNIYDKVSKIIKLVLNVQ